MTSQFHSPNIILPSQMVLWQLYHREACRYLREGELEVVGLDAANIVRSGCIQSLHQHSQRVPELQEERREGEERTETEERERREERGRREREERGQRREREERD